MKIPSHGRLWASLVFVLVLVSAGACSGRDAIGPEPPTLPVMPMDHFNHLVGMPMTTHRLCEKLLKGTPNTRVKRECSGKAKKELNAEVCYEPSGNCFNIPRSATVGLKQASYHGTLTASDTTKSLPSKILKSPYYISGLCGDKGKSAGQDPEDIIHVSPTTGHGPSSKFTVTDEGPRTKNHSGSSTCNIVFYDDTDRFVEFMVVMLDS